ncbi:MAG: ferredoxin-type protein NapF [Methyloligellaceae bacterium]
MAVMFDRRDLLRGRIGKRPPDLRPPYALSEAVFQLLCDGCGTCAEACPENVIAPDAQGFPVLRYQDTACTFCKACSTACPTGALDTERAAPWTIRATIRGTCLSFNGIVCRACGEHCDESAIGFTPLPGGRALPRVDEGVCTGCLKCAAVCPVGAIVMRPRPQQEIAA